MGAPEVIISALEGDYSSVLQQVNEYANDGNRVLLVARSTAPLSEGSCRQKRLRGAVEGANVSDGRQLDVQAEPVALVLCSEKIREDAERTLAWFREQGVRCRVISGDNPVTVGAIARRVKLTGDHEPVAMDARELPEDVNELARVLENVDVLGRVLPDQKKAIVQALHTQNHVVAMTWRRRQRRCSPSRRRTSASPWAMRRPPPRPWPRWCWWIRSSRTCRTSWRGAVRSWPIWSAWPACSSSKPCTPR